MIGGRDDAPQKATEYLRSIGANVVAAVSPPMGFEIGGPLDEEATRALVEADLTDDFAHLRLPSRHSFGSSGSTGPGSTCPLLPW